MNILSIHTRPGGKRRKPEENFFVRHLGFIYKIGPDLYNTVLSEQLQISRVRIKANK